ncbi:hypothetical protein AB4090_14980 [Acidithiobacillus sp. IBUN Pt1247-S3]|uniref:hypothetical protein n=1 Tax=Acidithiobacillus sp. IBUN Pt1247-S3 TaxID=3166642 RepID=UPI0034E4C356
MRPRVWISDALPTARVWGGDGQEIAVLALDDVLVDQRELSIDWGESLDLPALRALELLAYGFFDYDARECLCFQGVFDDKRCLLPPWECAVPPAVSTR